MRETSKNIEHLVRGMSAVVVLQFHSDVLNYSCITWNIIHMFNLLLLASSLIVIYEKIINHMILKKDHVHGISMSKCI